MKDFLKKTIYLWLSIVCFGIAIGLLYLLTDFFERGGGFIRIKGIIAPIVFSIFGLISLWKFIKNSFVEKNFIELTASVLLIGAVGYGVYYFSSSNYKTSQLLEKIQNGSISEDECISQIIFMLNEDNPESKVGAVECLKALTDKGSAQAWFKLGELYYEKQDYTKAEDSFIRVCEISEPTEVKNNDYRQIGHDLSLTYEYLGNIYNAGLSGDTDKKKALMYYERALQYQLNMHSDKIRKAIETIKSETSETEQ